MRRLPAFLPPRPGASKIEDRLRRRRNRWALACVALGIAAAYTWMRLVLQ